MTKRKRSKAGAWKDGVRRRPDGKYDVRYTWHDREGVRHDTERCVDVSSRGAAIATREQLRKESCAPRDLGWTFQEALDAFLPTLERVATRLAWGSHGKRITRSFEGRRLATIEQREVQRFLFELTDVADETTVAIRKVFRAVYVFARTSGNYDGPNPVDGTVPRRTPTTSAQRIEAQDNPVQRAYLGDEPQRFLDALPEDLRAMNTIQLLLGCRFGEVSALEWSNVDLETGVVRIRYGQYKGVRDVTKSSDPRGTAVGPYGLSVLRAHREQMAELQWPGWERLVFPRPPWGEDRTSDYWDYGTVRRHVLNAQAAIETKAASRTHAMRHTHITMSEVQRLMHVDAEVERTSALHRQMTGHASDAQRSRYVDKSSLPARKLAAEIERTIVGKIEGMDDATNRED